jgi:hypothetical protein
MLKKSGSYPNSWLFRKIKIYESINNVVLSVFIALISRILELDRKHVVIILSDKSCNKHCRAYNSTINV